MRTDATAEFRCRTIDLEGRSLAVTDSGRGTPCVVFETGLGAEAAEWKAVAEEVAPWARTICYDRAGRGASPPAAGPRSAQDIVDELHALLQYAEVPRPCLLVGHSFGGLLVRLYAHRYRSDVMGVVLVDSMHEDQFDVFGPLFPPETPGEHVELKGVRAFWTGGWRHPTSTQERIDLPASLAQGRAIASLGDLPLHVISAGTFTHMASTPPEARAFLQQRWDLLQHRLVALSSNAMHTVVPDSDHFVQRGAPGVIVEAIVGMIQAHRRLSPSSRPGRAERQGDLT